MDWEAANASATGSRPPFSRFAESRWSSERRPLLRTSSPTDLSAEVGSGVLLSVKLPEILVENKGTNPAVGPESFDEGECTLVGKRTRPHGELGQLREERNQGHKFHASPGAEVVSIYPTDLGLANLLIASDTRWAYDPILCVSIVRQQSEHSAIIVLRCG